MKKHGRADAVSGTPFPGLRPGFSEIRRSSAGRTEGKDKPGLAEGGRPVYL